MNALVVRSWKKRIKGRDWYDFEWYVRNGIYLNLNHFIQRAYQSEHIDTATLSKEKFMEMLGDKIVQLDIESAKEDVFNFLKDRYSLMIWSKDFFLKLISLIKFSSNE